MGQDAKDICIIGNPKFKEIVIANNVTTVTPVIKSLKTIPKGVDAFKNNSVSTAKEVDQVHVIVKPSVVESMRSTEEPLGRFQAGVSTFQRKLNTQHRRRPENEHKPKYKTYLVDI